jgi:hypothetical protein
MRSTRLAAPSAVLKSILCAAVAMVIGLSLAAPAGAASKPHSTACANRLCTKNAQNTPKCTRYHSRKKVARCFIARAAQHYHQSKGEAYYIAWRESRYNWHATNPSSGTAGLYQFARRTWNSTPYRHYSPYNPRMASLAAMWMWAHGGKSHWRA